MLELLTEQPSDKYDILLDKIHAFLDAALNDPEMDHSSHFNEIVDFLFDNFRVGKTSTMWSLDVERLDRSSLLVMNSTNLVHGIINGLIRFSRDKLGKCFSNAEGFKKFTDELWNSATQ